VNISLHAAGIRVVLLDIEGTTTPIAFVHDVLFPYARARTRTYLEDTPAADPTLNDAVAGLREEYARDAGRGEPVPLWKSDTRREELESLSRYVHWLMDQDRKSTPLKLLQGKIWERGYSNGELKGEVYPDVPAALERWAGSGVGVGIFSSGSVLAQRLLFANTNAGDLTRLLRWHFDTAVGAKVEAASYRAIVDALNIPSVHVLFVSDVVKELDAARAAGLQTALCVRAAPAQPPGTSDHPVVTSFDQIAV
jgi:enolase-phosphatase E1